MDMFHRFRRKKTRPLVIPTITETLPPSPHQPQIAGFPEAPDVHRNSTARSNLSSYAIVSDDKNTRSVERHRRERSAERHADPLGLSVLYEPEEGEPIADIIFVHGLGGTSQKTWSRNRDTQLFWPQQWLPLEPGFEQARILSFGYNAHFASAGRENMLDIADFAKDLLFGMKYGLNENSEALEVGKCPVIFVVHSMGGLVVKKAHILGQGDDQYMKYVKATSAILFLSTPHRGTNFAELLNKILTVSLFNHSPKHYIAELRQNSPALQDINEQFRNIAPRLDIFSFYETQQTAVGPRKMMVLEKDSSILGYPNEVSKPLDADHHNVCKYTNQQDPNYVSVRNALKSLLPSSTAAAPSRQPPGDGVGMNDVETLLAVSEIPEDDYVFFRDRWMPGSCEWIHSRSTYLSWLHDKTSASRILWVNGLPGCGKSVLSSFIVSQLQDMDYNCQYYFFRFGDHSKRTVNALLRSLAYQIAINLPELREQMQQMSEDGVKLEKAEGRTIWQKLFASKLCKIHARQPLYWVIDALDECEAPQLLLSLLSSVSSSRVPLRIVFVGRKTQALSASFQRIQTSIKVDELSANDINDDLTRYVEKEIEYMRGDSGIKARIVHTVREKANGNFLWVHLVLKEISQCHTEAAITQALEEMPPDLEPLYQRMEIALSNSSRSSDRKLSIAILTWVICSQRALTLEELSEALKPEFSSVLDLRLTISQVCGDFVVVDSKGRAGIVHQTAREYLSKTPNLDHSITLHEGHQKLFMKCISYLSRPIPRSRGDRSLAPSTPVFLQYAATSWSYHLISSAVSSDHSVLLALSQFFQSSYLLGWIELLAMKDQLKSLVYASQSLTSYLGKKSKVDAESSPLTHRLQEKEVLELWAVDLVKIVGKFGGQLVEHPRTIQSLIPTLCPTTTAIFQRFGQSQASGYISLGGFTRSKWDDCLSKFSVGRNTQSLRILSLERIFAILTSDGMLRLYDVLTNQPLRQIPHRERVLCFKFSPSHEKCVTYGFRTTKVWNVKDGRQICSIANPSNAKALDVSFANDESTIVSCSDDRAIRRYSLDTHDATWHVVSHDMEYEDTHGRQLNSPRRVAFNTDGTQVALAFRGFPLFVWDVENANMVGQCQRASDKNNSRQDLYSEIGPICWNPVTGHVLGLYKDGCIFKWHPWESDSQELRTVAAGIQCSLDGVLFVTSSTNELFQVWNFHHFALVYQLSYHIPIIDIALSPDGRRVYDLRESYCNIWEPNALIRLAEADEKSSETTSTAGGSTQISFASEASSETLEPLTALATGSRIWSYCSGDDAGVVRLVRAFDQASIQIVQGFMPVDHIVWSDDEKYVVTADLGGRLNVRIIEDSGPSTKCPLLFETKTGSGLRQILLDTQCEHLLLVTTAFTELWSLKSKTMITTKPNVNPYSRWITHPSNSAFVIQCTFVDVRIHEWSSLDEIDCRPFNEPEQGDVAEDMSEDIAQSPPPIPTPMSPDENCDSVEEIFVSKNVSYVLLQTSRPSVRKQRMFQYLTIRIDDLAVPSDSSVTSIEARPIPQAVTAKIQKIWGFVSQSPRRKSQGLIGEAETEAEEVLAFLDHDDWVCSWTIGRDETAEPKIKRHFFLPQDWLNLDSLRLATISSDGKFYCPRNGEVAVVSNWLQNDPQWHCNVDSFESGSGYHDCTQAYDQNDDTWWHTEYAQDSPSSQLPHYIDIDLGKEYIVSGLTYLPRQDNQKNGNIGQFAVTLTKAGFLGAEPIPRTDFNGLWPDDKERKTASFPAKIARYVRLTAMSEAGGRGPWTSVAQIDIYQDPDHDTSCAGSPCPQDVDTTNTNADNSSPPSAPLPVNVPPPVAPPPAQPITVTATAQQQPQSPNTVANENEAPTPSVVTVSAAPAATQNAGPSVVTSVVSAATTSSNGAITVTSIQPAPTVSQAGAPAAAVADSSYAVMGKLVDIRVAVMGLVAAVGVWMIYV
ncbi:MAG: hypothetical protein Q9168_003931 [Polycauliona sp. 1 TL-2023]